MCKRIYKQKAYQLFNKQKQPGKQTNNEITQTVEKETPQDVDTATPIRTCQCMLTASKLCNKCNHTDANI